MSRSLVIIGGSDAGISAGLRARELDPTAEVTVVVADAYPNYSICGIPYYVSGEVAPWQSLAHRTYADLEAAGLTLRVNTRATAIDVAGQRVAVTDPDGTEELLAYDELVVGTGAHPAVPAIAGVGGPDGLGPAEGVHLLHTIDDTHALMASLTGRSVGSALIVGAGYIGVEMSEALVARGVATTIAQRPAEVLATVDAELGSLVRAEMEAHGVEVLTGTSVTALARTADGQIAATGGGLSRSFDVVVIVAGVRPDVALLVGAGATTGAGGAVVVDETMATGLPHVWAAGDCVITHHRLMGLTYLPLGTTAHKQGRVAGANAVGGHARFAGSVGTQVVKVFDLVAARTGLLEHEAVAAGFRPVTTQTSPNDHKAYYPGAQPITIRVTADADTGRLLGAQLVGRLGSEIAKRADVFATALFHAMTVEGIADLDLAYTPPLGSPWDAVQMAAQAWSREHRPPSIDALPSVPSRTDPLIKEKTP
ncbi:putative pyridine nucleotide-disulphide oxidoreductase [Modestobacter italicus]|uniref:Pyridine nucleotide-disulphide oxidoreductase n=1 Tax=Modestobacter italicus (strain DSM 44449 / CECT 9708 / BC 501) TaxID=2732864 RepID=I4EVE9_MODI5|nr:FAD-dependent oxidoreductase [Modestobacter marinus]CCH87362.1 putative pyridine nucleotide-disulphide oxidoreductase [Modestobacter marinus]